MKDAYADQPPIPDYETAAEVFNSIKPYDGQPHIVPLRGNRGRDYGLVHKEGMYILLRNDQPIIKYLRPKPEEVTKVASGHHLVSPYLRQVEVTNNGTRGMSRFFAHHRWQSWVPRLETDKGTMVCAPFIPNHRTLLTFDANDKLVLKMSHHEPIFTRHTSLEQKALAQQVLEKMLPVANLALMRSEDLLAGVHLHDRYWGGNFDPIKVDARGVGECSDLSVVRVVQKYALSDPINPIPLDHALPTLMLLAGEVLTFIASKKWKALEAEMNHVSARDRGVMWERVKAQIQPDEFMRTFKYAVLKCCALHTPNAKVQLPMFPERLPRRVFL
jgi:hypothetical protein